LGLLFGKSSKHIAIIWSTEQPYKTIQHVREIAKPNVFCALSTAEVCWLNEHSTDDTQTDMPTLVMLQLLGDIGDDFGFSSRWGTSPL
jgi:hypothetical protein